jgi:hypothetical protein
VGNGGGGRGNSVEARGASDWMWRDARRNMGGRTIVTRGGEFYPSPGGASGIVNVAKNLSFVAVDCTK